MSWPKLAKNLECDPANGSRLWGQGGPSEQAPLPARSEKAMPLDARLKPCGCTKWKVEVNARWHTLTGSQQAHCLSCDNGLPGLAFRRAHELASAHWTAGQTVMNPAAHNALRSTAFCSFRAGAKHHVLNTSDATRLARFPKRLVHGQRTHVLLAFFQKESYVANVCCAEGSVGREVLRRGCPLRLG